MKKKKIEVLGDLKKKKDCQNKNLSWPAKWQKQGAMVRQIEIWKTEPKHPPINEEKKRNICLGQISTNANVKQNLKLKS